MDRSWRGSFGLSLSRCGLALLAALACGVAVNDAAAADQSFWHIEHSVLVDGSGRKLAMRGVNLGGWLHWEGYLMGGSLFASETRIYDGLVQGIGPGSAQHFRQQFTDSFITEADIAQIAGLGFNTIRLPVNWRGLTQDSSCPRCDGSRLAAIDRVLGWAAKYDLHVIIDMHSTPAGASNSPTADPVDVPSGDPTAYLSLTYLKKIFAEPGPLWRDADARSKLVDLWRTIALRYRDNPAVGGYDLINEPVAPQGSALTDLYARLIAAIRSVDRHHVIWLEGNALASDFGFFQTPVGDNVGLSVHLYTVLGDSRAKHLADAAEAAKRIGAPLWLGEFGEDSPDKIESTLTMFEAVPQSAGWTIWTWKRAPTFHSGLCVFNPPRAWHDIAGWITGSVLERHKPDEAVIEQGAQAFLVTIANYKCQPDATVMDVLQKH
jgi:endoglucanase